MKNKFIWTRLGRVVVFGAPVFVHWTILVAWGGAARGCVAGAGGDACDGRSGLGLLHADRELSRLSQPRDCHNQSGAGRRFGWHGRVARGSDSLAGAASQTHGAKHASKTRVTKRVRSFDLVAAKDARILILGSMPGERSLAAAEYYAHPRNAFWRIMQEVAGVDPAASYDERLRSLKRRGIALWDVLHSCERQGSLDAAIEKGSVKVNDFEAFFRGHLQIRVVLLNGGTAERYYKRYVLPVIANEKIEHIGMPSTSPAHAAMSIEQKIKVWRDAIARRSL